MYVKRYSTLLISEVQVKTKVKHHLTSIKVAITKMTGNNKCWQECGEQKIFEYGFWKCKLVQPPRKTKWRFLKEFKNRTTV